MLNRLRKISATELWTLLLLVLGMIALLLTYPPEPSLTRPWLWRSAFLAIAGCISLLVPALVAAYILRRPVILAYAAIVGAVAGLGANAGLTLYAAARFGQPIRQAIAQMKQQTGTIAIVQNGNRLIPLRVVGQNRVERTAGWISEVTPLEMQFLCAAEDERCFDRKLNIDLEAIGRVLSTALRRTFRHQEGRLPGGSNLSEQVAGLLLGLKPAGPDALWWKLDKMLAAFQVDLLPREQQAAIYLSLAPFGNWHGQDIVGIGAASQVFYGRDHSQLSAGELAELMARLRNPVQLFPYQRSQETEQHFNARLRAEQARAQAIVNVAIRKAWLPQSVSGYAGETFNTLLAPEIARQQLDIPHLKQIIDAVQTHVPDLSSRRVVVLTDFDPPTEQALADAAAAGFAEFYPLLPASSHADDFLEVDATVIDERTGHLVAEVGLATMPGGCASHCKPELYGLALETGALLSMNQTPPCSRISANLALARSVNETALCLIRLVGPARYMKHLQDQGYNVQGPYVPIALGAGVEVSPRRVAANYLKFGFTHPGWRIEPDAIARIVDANTGAVLYEPKLTRVFSTETAVAVRAAMEDVARIGTASHALAHIPGALPSKTGTAGAFRRNAWQGDGGSWCVTIDSVSGLVVAIRVRWRSNHPFELEGGRTAAVIMAEFIQRARPLRAQQNRNTETTLIAEKL